MDVLVDFHPLIQRWFCSRFAAQTEPQREGWPHIAGGAHTLIAAPTGSGKTLTAFLAVIDRLLRRSLAGELDRTTRVVYVSPLRALSNDMHRNLELPLAEIMALVAEEGIDAEPIRAGLRTGDTTSSQRAALVRKPPHILVTTPESLYLMLTGPKSRETLRNTEAVIVDEIHALIRDKRGSHLSLTLERLESLCGQRLQRIGLSATQKPLDRVAKFLVGCREGSEEGGLRTEDGVMSPLSPTGDVPSSNVCQWGRGAGGEGAASDVSPSPQPSPPLESSLKSPSASGGEGVKQRELHQSSIVNRQSSIPCRVVDVGHQRQLDLGIEVPPSELGAACTHEQWAEVYERIVALINEHRSTLVFVNTRRMAERITHQLTERLGEDVVSSHHGSLAAKKRLDTERKLKSGELKAVVATASLELGLDVGYIDLVIQVGSPRSIATFLQRIGRSGHSLGLVPKGRLFALSRDELLEAMALMRAVRGGRLDTLQMPDAPIDVLAQQIVAEVAGSDWHTDDLFALCRRAYPYRNLPREKFDRTLDLLSEGIAPHTGRGRVYVHHDRVGKRLKTRKGSRITAASNGGAIPEIASYRVVAQPDQTVVGTLDEDFAVESMAGDIFLLGNTSWRIQNVRGGDVNVVDAHGAPPTIPFWNGEAPGRTWELSEELSRLRGDGGED